MNATLDDMVLDPVHLAPEKIRPLMRREYEALVATGCLDDVRVELLRGQLVEMSPQGTVHSRLTAWFGNRLVKALPLAEFEIRQHSPFSASDDSMPEPDVSVSLLRADGRHPEPGDVLLLIEVANSSLTKDRTIKREIYAEAGVPEYWIVSGERDYVDVLTQPTATGYASSVRLHAGDVLRPTGLPGVELAVADVPFLPREIDKPGTTKR